jgi:hypothetical protein
MRCGASRGGARSLPLALAVVSVIGASLTGAALGAAVAQAAPVQTGASGAPGESGPAPGAALLPAAARGAHVQITMPPIGLSIEYPLMAQQLGSGVCPPPALVAELLRLGSPPLHLGGNSQDLTVPSGAILPPYSSFQDATFYYLPANFWTQLHCLLSATKEHLTAGLNAERGELAWAQQMVAGAETAATNGVDFSIGNEPDLYYLPNYASLGEAYVSELASVNTYLQVASYLRQAIGSAPLLGPELAIAKDWRHQLLRVIDTLHFQTVGVHLYPLSACSDPASVTIPRLLSRHSVDAPDKLAWVVADARAAGVPAILSEANSASCGGEAGVSDTPAAGVWSVGYVLDALLAGFQEVRFHLSGGPYDPFVVRGGRVIERPLASALAALQRWLPVGATAQTLTGVHGLVTTAVSGAPSGAQLIFDNEHTRAQSVALRSAAPLRVEALSSTHAGVLMRVLPAREGSVKIDVPADSVLAVLARS